MRVKGAAGVALAAIVLGLGASSAPASASGPVWAYCGKVKAGTGGFTDKLCSVGEPEHLGAYELIDGIGKGKGFKGKGSGEARFNWNIPGKGEFDLECSKLKVVGTPVAPNRVAGVVISFQRCRTNISDYVSTCVAHTVPLAGQLGWIDHEAGTAGVELSSEAEPGGLIAEVEGCVPGVKQRLSGSVIASLSPVGAVSKTSTLSFVSRGFYTEETGFIYDNLPVSFEGEEAEHFLVNEVNSPESGFEWTTAGARSGGLDATMTLKGEPLMIR